MGKVKQQPESLKPGIQHDTSISKNKKRKEKRLSKNFTLQKTETGDFIPVKKASLLPLNKIKNEAKQNGLSSPKGKKENAQLLSTSLPIKSNKKDKNTNIGNSSFASFLPKGKKPVTGILSNRNTPKKNKSDRVTFKDESVKPKSFIDDEAEEGEEPISCKMVKPYEKKGKKAVKRHAEESSDDSSDDDDAVYDAKDLIDMEASDGDETDDDSGSEISDDGEDVSDEDESDENTNTNMNISNFDLGDEDDSDDDDDDDDEEDDDEDDEDEDESDSEDEPVQKNKTPKKNDSILKVKQEASTPKLKELKQNTPLKTPSKLEKGAKQETPLQVKKAKLDKSAQETPLKTSVTKDQLQKENKNSAKKAKLEAALGETKQEKKPEVKSNIKNESPNKNDNVGFIRNVPEKISEAEIKAIIGKKCGPDNVVNVVLTNKRKGSKLRNAYVHIKNVKLLESILNNKFTIGDFSFPVYKAKKENIMKPVAFLPRVPIWASNDLIKQAIDADIGAGSVINLEVKKEDTKTQTKNVLIYFSTMDAMKKAIFQGEYKVKDTSVIVREAKEAGIKIPVYRAVITDIPDKTTEALLTKTLEAKIGADTIHNIRFSFRKNSFAFVVFKTEEAQKKALELADTLSLKNTKIKIIAYVPRTSRKRAPANEHTKQKRAEKKKSQKSATEATGDKEKAQTPSPKKMKQEESTNSPNNKSKKKNKKSIASPTGAVKAKKNPVMKGKKKFTQKKESVQQDKVSPVKEQIKGKKENPKSQMKQKKQKAKKAE